ncbi:MAG: hypothetical protein SCK28_05865, partial [Bacillota bacterium]|nr:hypothetical protein [Bacillota bacterium]
MEMMIGAILFFLVIGIVAFLAGKYTKSVKDYLVGNRNVGGIISAFTWTASAASAGLFLGAAGLAYSF